MSEYFNTLNKAHNRHAVGFNQCSLEAFDTVNVSASTADTSILAIIPLSQDCKIYHISIACLALTGAATVEVVYGTATPGATGTPAQAAVNGTSVFSAPVAVPAAGSVTVINAPVCDTVYPKGTSLTLRATTAAGNTVTGLKVQMAIAAIDPSPNANMLPSPSGTTGFDPSCF